MVFRQITISTPKVLKRIWTAPLPEELKEQIEVTMFGYGSLLESFNIVVGTSKYKNLASSRRQN